MLAAGVPDLLFERFPGRLECHSPWHRDRVLSHLFRGRVEVAEANALLAEHGHEAPALARQRRDRAAMEGLEGPPTPTTWSPAAPARRRRSRSTCGRAATRRSECIGVGDSLEDLDVADAVGRFFVAANGPERDPGLREAIGGRPNVTVTEGGNGDGFYEAVVGDAWREARLVAARRRRGAADAAPAAGRRAAGRAR